MDPGAALSSTTMKPNYKDKKRELLLLGVVVLTGGYTLAQLILSHITHSLTLLVDSYHMVYNILTLMSTILGMKMCRRPKHVKNTFGWYRIEVLGTVVSLVFLVAMCFSLCVTSIQTLVHVSHEDAMHFPGIVALVALIGVAMNIVCVMAIGGYSHHQSCLVLGKRTISTSSRNLNSRWPSLHSVGRDIHGCILVIICSALVGFTDESIAVFVDPLLALVSISCLMLMSRRYMVGTTSILLQTLPANMDVGVLKKELLRRFPSILNVHDFHLWCLTPHVLISTMHLVFRNEQVYITCAHQLKQFFTDHNIHCVTIQPEFISEHCEQEPTRRRKGVGGCLLRCITKDCEHLQCCNECAQGPGKEIRDEDCESFYEIELMDKRQEGQVGYTEEEDPLMKEEEEERRQEEGEKYSKEEQERRRDEGAKCSKEEQEKRREEGEKQIEEEEIKREGENQKKVAASEDDDGQREDDDSIEICDEETTFLNGSSRSNRETIV